MVTPSEESLNTGDSQDSLIIMICPACNTPYYINGGSLVHDLGKIDVTKLVKGSAPCRLCENERNYWPTR
jgi:hypothetical protein